jgi:hypothetical protein
MFDSTLTETEWRHRRSAYLDRVRPWALDRMRRAGRQQKHPVYDFLFEYYSYRPSYLLRWSPGVAVRLEGATADALDWRPWFRLCEGGWTLPAEGFPDRRRSFLRWAIEYLEAIDGRESFYGCFGLHEWAMVYREPEVRHGRVPLRLSRGETDAVIDEASIVRCTHYDAFRFFTPAARPLNRAPLTRPAAVEHDQPGCLHANMDLYKWAYVLAPYTSGELIADAFELALAARELDMRASPYDLRSFGFAPIRIETREGREEYVAGQRGIADRAVPVRRRLLGELLRLERLTSGQTANAGSEKYPIAAR